jgi:hypothetical protein
MRKIQTDELVLGILFEALEKHNFQICNDFCEPHHPSYYEEADRKKVLAAYRSFRKKLVKKLLAEKREIAAKETLTWKERETLRDLDIRIHLLLPVFSPTAREVVKIVELAREAIWKEKQ